VLLGLTGYLKLARGLRMTMKCPQSSMAVTSLSFKIRGTWVHVKSLWGGGVGGAVIKR
jgi:hypothetical protein